jgi:hypothetical protein
VSIAIRSIKVSQSFQITNTCGSAVAAGASCSISAVFQALSSGRKTGLITIVDSSSTKPQLIELNGSATVVKVLPGSLSFGNQKVGSRSKPQTVTATNEGKTSTTYSVNIGGAESRDFSETDNCAGISIPPGGSCKVNVTFDPTTMGPRSAKLNITLQGVNPAPVVLTGTGD